MNALYHKICHVRKPLSSPASCAPYSASVWWEIKGEVLLFLLDEIEQLPKKPQPVKELAIDGRVWFLYSPYLQQPGTLRLFWDDHCRPDPVYMPAAPLCVSGHGGSVLTRCRLLGPCLLLGASLRLRSPLLAQLAPHAGAAEHREQVVEGAVWPGCLVRCSCRGALRVGADSVSKPGMSSTIALSPEVELSRQGEQWPGDCPVRFSYLLCSSHCVVCV